MVIDALGPDQRQALQRSDLSQVYQLFKAKVSVSLNGNDSYLLVFRASDELILIGRDRCHCSAVSLDRLGNLAFAVPHLNEAVFATSVDPALFVEDSTEQARLLGLSERALLSEALGYVGRVPEIKFFGAYGHES